MKNKNTGLKIMIVLTLILSVAGLSLGFANYASNLKIESSAKYQLNLEGQPTWLVSFDQAGYESSISYDGIYNISKENNDNDKKITRFYEPYSGSINPKGCTDAYSAADSSLSDYNESCSDVEATDVNVKGLTASGIKVSFKNLSSAVMYLLPVGNYGLVDAYLKSVTFDGTPTCTAADGATVSNEALNAICNNLDVIFRFNGTDYNKTVTNIKNNKLESGIQIISGLRIGLKSSDEALTNVALEKVNISIPDITLGFSSVD